MKVWIDQNLCTGDGLCTEIVPDIFEMHDDGLAYVKAIGEAGLILAEDGLPIHRMGNDDGMVTFPESLLEEVIEAADECPGECIFIETA